jgi:hypothetical protein
MNVNNMAVKLTTVKNKFGLDDLDLTILGRLQLIWNKGWKVTDEVTVMEIIKQVCVDIASPASLHHRISALANADLIKLTTNKKDARVKHVREGVNFKKLEKSLGA